MDTPNLEGLPSAFRVIIEDFQEAEQNERLELLLEFAKELPPLPPHWQDRTAEMEQVTECQTPFFLVSEVEDGKVNFYYDVPMEAPTTRGYASILAQGLNGSSPDTVFKVPSDFYRWIGLSDLISPLRLRGVQAVLNRMKRQMREYIALSP